MTESKITFHKSKHKRRGFMIFALYDLFSGLWLTGRVLGPSVKTNQVS